METFQSLTFLLYEKMPLKIFKKKTPITDAYVSGPRCMNIECTSIHKEKKPRGKEIRD